MPKERSHSPRGALLELVGLPDKADPAYRRSFPAGKAAHCHCVPTATNPKGVAV